MHTKPTGWGKCSKRGPIGSPRNLDEHLVETELGFDLNEQTKECVELVPRVFRVASSEKPTKLSKFPKVETADTDNGIKYDRNDDEIYESSARCIWAFDV